MRLNIIAIIVLCILIIILYRNCERRPSPAANYHPSIQEGLRKYSLGNYWYRGFAELNVFELNQVRYNETRKGEAVIIFVTEDFSKAKQVKLDNPDSKSVDVQPVLKMNFSKKFTTGVYPYSMLLSAFTPIGEKVGPNAIKVSCSVQEWCGHVYNQLNNKGDYFDYHSYSYFETEGDIHEKLPISILEDEIWSLIRINPTLLPQGNFHILPGSFFLRLKHFDVKAIEANAYLNIHSDSTYLYTLKMPDHRRTLMIEYKGEAPYEIISWQEDYPEGGIMMSTMGRIKKRILLDYWNHNKIADSLYRKDIQISY